jgi:hypothetical protein
MKLCTKVYLFMAYNFAEVNIDDKSIFGDRIREFLNSFKLLIFGDISLASKTTFSSYAYKLIRTIFDRDGSITAAQPQSQHIKANLSRFGIKQ